MSCLASVDPEDGPCRAVPNQTRNQRDGTHDVGSDRRRPWNDMKKSQSQQRNSNRQPNSTFYSSNIHRHDVLPLSMPDDFRVQPAFGGPCF
jgi:hypothetical protein